MTPALGARHERLAREQALDPAHAPMRSPVLGKERRHAPNPCGLRLGADAAEGDAVRQVGLAHRLGRVEPRSLPRDRESRCRRDMSSPSQKNAS